MDGLSIVDAARQFGVTSKALRYYERVGLLSSRRTESNNYRAYSEQEVERIRQILILRKMQIPIKDILRIYENKNMRTVVEVFVARIEALDDEVGALTELRRITNEFLQTMIKNGITKISAIPLLYEEMDRQLSSLRGPSPTRPMDLEALSERLDRPADLRIVALAPMRVLSSLPKDGGASDAGALLNALRASGLPPALPGGHEQFEYQAQGQTVVIRQVANGFENDGPFVDFYFDGGLFATTGVYLDEDLGGRFRALVKALDTNKYYQIDHREEDGLRPGALLEALISPDDQRELVALLVPVKKRLADPALFEAPREARGLTPGEIEAANPILWQADVDLRGLTQSHPDNSFFTINSDGEAEFIGYILRAVLNTHVSVRLPFRVDLVFYQPGGGKTGVVFYHGEDTGYPTGDIGNRGFGVNMGNDAGGWAQAIRFHQPIFLDGFRFPGRGALQGGVNRLTWIVGQRHLAVILNGETRYCGIRFPYMSLDLSRERSVPIVVGASGSDRICFRSIRIFQLSETQNIKLKEGELTMMTKRSNNLIPTIHRLVTDEYGENYWFNGCVRYVMEGLGEGDMDYWFFAGLTGDLFTQHYTYTKYSGDALSSYRMDAAPAQFVEDTFLKCGYAATYVPNREMRKNPGLYLPALMDHVDRGVPVMVWGHRLVGVIVGYEEYGQVLLYITGNNNQPERLPLEEALEGLGEGGGWVFIGEKTQSPPLAGLYRGAIEAIPRLFGEKTEAYCFGQEAFRAWARDIEGGKFDRMEAEAFDAWAYYTNYVCVLATNGSCCHNFLERARALNPDMGYLEEVGALYRRTAEMWGGAGDQSDADSLEALGGGFNITLATLQNRERRGRIAAKIRDIADVADAIARVVQANMKQ